MSAPNVFTLNFDDDCGGTDSMPVVSLDSYNFAVTQMNLHAERADTLRRSLDGATRAHVETLTKLDEAVALLRDVRMCLVEHLSQEAHHKNCRVEELCPCFTDQALKAERFLARIDGKGGQS